MHAGTYRIAKCFWILCFCLFANRFLLRMSPLIELFDICSLTARITQAVNVEKPARALNMRGHAAHLRNVNLDPKLSAASNFPPSIL